MAYQHEVSAIWVALWGAGYNDYGYSMIFFAIEFAFIFGIMEILGIQ